MKLDLYQGTSGTYAGYDRFGRTVRHEWDKYGTGAGVRDRVDYAYDTAGNRLTRDIPSSLYATNDRDQAYTYDGLHRLKTFDEGTLVGMSISGPPEREEDFTLDQLGNWPGYVKKSAGTTDLNQTRYHNAVNEIDGNGGNSITASIGANWADPVHDAAGNMTTMPKPAAPTNAFTLKYDAWNRLVEVKDASLVLQKNEYDGLGRRIVRNVHHSFTGTFVYAVHYYYNDQWQLLEERKELFLSTEDPDPLNQYVWHPYYIDALAVRYYDANTDGDYLDTNEGAHHYLQDANYNVTAVVNASGTVLERYRYSPYGEVTFLDSSFVIRASSLIANTHLYTGRERDSETGLQLNRERYYASHLGRWVNRDPIRYHGGMNLYGYVAGRPTYYVDPSGLQQLWPGQVPEPGQPIPPSWYPPPPPNPRPIPPPIPPNPGTPPGPGWEWRPKGSEPGSPGGAWHNPGTGESLHPDLNHHLPKGPHWGWRDRYGKTRDYFPDTGKWKEAPGNKPNRPRPQFPEGTFEAVTAIGAGLTAGAIIYIIISEGSRILCPPRNLIPVP